MERFCGRRPDDKEHETIHIDIDLLAHGDTIIKPMDFAQYQHDIENLWKEYIRKSLIYA